MNFKTASALAADTMEKDFSSINFVVRANAFEQNGILPLVLHKLKYDTQVITRAT